MNNFQLVHLIITSFSSILLASGTIWLVIIARRYREQVLFAEKLELWKSTCVFMLEVLENPDMLKDIDNQIIVTNEQAISVLFYEKNEFELLQKFLDTQDQQKRIEILTGFINQVRKTSKLKKFMSHEMTQLALNKKLSVFFKKVKKGN